MSDGKIFLDTNVLVYLYSDSEPEKQKTAYEQIEKDIRYISTQVLTEFCNICIKKLKMSITDIDIALTALMDICELVEVDDATLRQALLIHNKLNYTFYDSVVIYSALASGCDYLYTEDMQDGQVIENRLVIKNIFKQ